MDSKQVAQGEPPNALENTQVPVQMKLAAAWTSFMFLYIYVDYLGLYKPGFIDDILAGVVFEFDISQTFVVIALTSVAIPTFMILLSMTLPARVNRAINLVVATLLIPYSAFNVVGGSWLYFYGLGVVLEVIILAYILRSAWTWPRTSSASAPEPAAPRRSQIQMGR
jgi:membrane-anchored protein YejM (alkaline phosphatase superfamily)